MKLLQTWSSPRVFAALLSILQILPVTLAASSANTLFKIPSGSTPGSCDPYSLDQVISDASNMAQAAITAISNYQQQSAFSAAAPGVLNTREASFAMFGVTSTKFLNRVVLSSSGSATLTNVKKNYQNVINLLKSSSLMTGTSPAIVACDDTFLTWVTQMQDILPNLQGTQEGAQTILSVYQEMDPNFPSTQGFYRSNWENANLMIADEGKTKSDGTPGGALCTDGTIYAETWAHYGFMLLCPRMFQLPANVASVVGSSGGTPAGTDINTFKSAAGAFLHEMLHFLGTNTATGGKIIDVIINGQESYGWEQCSILGTNEPVNALLNADSYHYFAVASSLGSVNFGLDGIAQ